MKKISIHLKETSIQAIARGEDIKGIIQKRHFHKCDKCQAKVVEVQHELAHGALPVESNEVSDPLDLITNIKQEEPTKAHKAHTNAKVFGVWTITRPLWQIILFVSGVVTAILLSNKKKDK